MRRESVDQSPPPTHVGRGVASVSDMVGVATGEQWARR
jgi:hypothetical protein